MKKLEEIILDRVDDESLFMLNKKYPSLKIEYEWERRLLSCDPELYVPVLDLFEKRDIKMNKTLRSAFYEMRKCFPFRIGVIYDFLNGQVKSLEVRMGTNNKKYLYQNSPIIFTWLDANESKKLLREVVSSNASNSIFSLKLDEEKSEKVRDLLLDNATVDIDVVVLEAVGNPFHSFPGSSPLTGGETYVVYPTRIKKNNITIDVFSKHDSPIVRFSNVSIQFSSDVIKYLSVISKI